MCFFTLNFVGFGFIHFLDFSVVWFLLYLHRFPVICSRIPQVRVINSTLRLHLVLFYCDVYIDVPIVFCVFTTPILCSPYVYVTTTITFKYVDEIFLVKRNRCFYLLYVQGTVSLG